MQLRPAEPSGRPDRVALADTLDTGTNVEIRVTDTGPGWRARLAGLTLLALRIVSALVLFEHATAQAFGIPNNPAKPFTSAPAVFSRLWVASWLELIGGTLIIMGLFTRPTAFVLSGLMAFAYFLVHAPVDIVPLVNRGEPAVLLCFVFLYMSAAGAGPYSVDALLARR
ncbi:MAG: DoxX family protein [Gemmatimonadetes bacterium]|nr:DoxX family protein [Gemmatimonadota bacterium]